MLENQWGYLPKQMFTVPNQLSVKYSMLIHPNENFRKSPGQLTALQNRVVNLSHHDLLLTNILESNGCLKLKEKRRQGKAAMTGI